MKFISCVLVAACPLVAQDAAPVESVPADVEATPAVVVPPADQLTPLQPAPEQPAEPAPAAEQPAPEQPAEPAPAAEQPAPEQPAEPAPAAEQPAPEQPAEPEPAPAAEQPAPEQPTEPAPAAEQPAPEQPAEPAPAAEPPAPEQPAEPAPAAEQPAPEPPAEPAPAEKAPVDPYLGIVKIHVSSLTPNYKTPWQPGAIGGGTGTGFMVKPGLFLTNAHVVANAQRIFLTQYADARKIPAQVLHVAHDADLALLKVENVEPFSKVPCLELSTEIPALEDVVSAVGYPIGGDKLSVTRGIVSRVDTIVYAHSRGDSHLAVQVDAAINPGNSGGPVLKGNQVVGVAFQGMMGANSTGYMIPASVIHHFLTDVEDGKYDGYVELGARFMPAENVAIRRHYGLKEDNVGCLVADVLKGSCCDGALQQGDIVLSVNDLPVDSSAMIALNGVRVQLEELAERSFSGDKMRFRILRQGEQMQTEATLAPMPSLRIMSRSFDEQPRYVHFAGLVFQPLEYNVINAHGVTSRNYAVELDRHTRRGGHLEHADVVLLTTVLPDEVNARFTNRGRGIVTRVNGQQVKGLAHLHSLLYPEDPAQRPPFTVIELADANRPFVIDNAAAEAANARISSGYNMAEHARLNP